MIYSMTGYGEASGSHGALDVTVEVKSVNNKHLNVKLSVPDVLRSRERDIESSIRSRINRGAVQVFIKIKSQSKRAKYRFNTDVVRSYLGDLRSLAEQLQEDAPDTLSQSIAAPALQDLLALPGVLEEAEQESDLDEIMEQVSPILDKALTALLSMRSAEGEHLEQHVRGICKDIATQVDSIETRAPTVVEDYREKLTKRINALLKNSGLQIDDSELLREIAVFADRADIEEEITRLRAHLDQAGTTLDSDTVKGRKLDFLTQEMLREANTIGSKANDKDIARCVVELKTCIEQFKEQVQNIE